MLIERQAETIAFLTDPATHGLRDGTAVEKFETHISTVVLVGERAFKLKRAVRLPYVDFSTASRRLAACEREVLLNRRTAPRIYLGVRKITRKPDGKLEFDGSGPLVDAVVEMVRFEQSTLFDAMAKRGALTPSLLTGLAREIARFHDGAAIERRVGGAANIAAVLTINERALKGSSIFPRESVAEFNHAFRRELARYAPLLDRRALSGKIRHCHGDLHLRNICLFDRAPILFDCLEFDDSMATVDVLYDLAFLLMDLWHRDLRQEANLVFNRYLDERDESDGLPLVPLFMAIRAAVRAHVTATAIEEQADPRGATSLRDEAEAYFQLALTLLQRVPSRLVAVGGLSGSGKSTVAAAIAPRVGGAPGARVFASDRIRKCLSGVAPETRLPETAYRPEVSERVYHLLAQQAEKVLGAGYSVVADAVFDRAENRKHIAEVARHADVPFTGLWLEAAADTLIQRVEGRSNDPSDATAEVVRGQLARLKQPVEWLHIDASVNVRSVTDAAIKAITRERGR